MITKEQCRAARGLLGWTAKQLAAAADIGVMTVSRFEGGQGDTYPATRSVIHAALEAGGVEFIPENGGGAGVRLRKGGAPHVTEPTGARSIGPEDEDRAGPEAPEN